MKGMFNGYKKVTLEGNSAIFTNDHSPGVNISA